MGSGGRGLPERWGFWGQGGHRAGAPAAVVPQRPELRVPPRGASWPLAPLRNRHLPRRFPLLLVRAPRLDAPGCSPGRSRGGSPRHAQPASWSQRASPSVRGGSPSGIPQARPQRRTAGSTGQAPADCLPGPCAACRCPPAAPSGKGVAAQWSERGEGGAGRGRGRCGGRGRGRQGAACAAARQRCALGEPPGDASVSSGLSSLAPSVDATGPGGQEPPESPASVSGSSTSGGTRGAGPHRGAPPQGPR